ncbi:hypothetical protein HOA55_01340 [archaeon]|jgi:hypothetical protein|nr:hypothetical protein [archaeon]MBT3578050.1 hypothetical protein [archaeon]MBT6819977.1 hypothetical protein [archaeon]MBT6956641.1 hypothetical protein [archaeon]MBT7025014.1 hypothetical protein [archaeon]
MTPPQCDPHKISPAAKSARKEAYKAEFDKGYRFRTNTPEDQVNERTTKFRTEGLHVLVSDVAFNEEGTELQGYKAHLVKKNYRK